MKIGIDVSILHRGGGVANYIHYLLSGLKSAHTDEQYTLFCNSFHNPCCPITDPFFPTSSFHIPDRVLNFFWTTLRYPPIERLIGPVDVFHSPAHSPVYAYSPPAKKWVVTVHDLFTFKLNYRRETQEKELRVLQIMDQKASRVISVSQSTRNDLIEMFPGLADRTVVIPEGVDERFFRAEISASALRKYGIEGPYILYVGAADPHKNLQRLVNAYGRLSVKTPRTLVLAGKITEYYRRIMEHVHQSGLSSRVVFTDRIADEDLPALYKGADLLVLPSLYEGFGLVLLEAMACGTPVAASNLSSIPEVLGDAGAFFDPYDENDLCACCSRVLNDSEQMRRMQLMGLERARLFSWQRMAEETLEVYREVATS